MNCPMVNPPKKPPACKPAPLVRTERNNAKYFNINTAYGTPHAEFFMNPLANQSIFGNLQRSFFSPYNSFDSLHQNTTFP